MRIKHSYLSAAVGAAVAGGSTTPVVSPAITGEARLQHATDSAINYATAGVLSEKARDSILEALKDADLPIFDAVRSKWVTTYRSEREANEEAGAKAWERFCKEFGIDRPKSVTKAATDAAAKREAEKKAREALPLAKVESAKAAAIKAAQEAQAKGDFKAATKANSEAATMQAELVRREKEANRGKEDMLNAKRKAIAEKLKTANLETLAKIEQLLDLVASNATTEAIAALIHQKPAAAVPADKARKAA